MQLKNIKINGFKSFADKVDIEIKDGITVIVGPNGSGKSNIVDAVKWVLGEQSVKALRGSNAMSDVIFQGSSSRKPLTRASVSLTFENKDHYLNSEYEELEIKRTVYASGENEYTINNSKVRLKDILDLFLDSGAGKEAFSIISQGKIGEILNSRPEERRTIIEEAAGVLKYKKRKIESLRKLEKTNDNLSKIDLIINELSATREPLKIDAERATKYKGYKEELEKIEISLLINDITNLNEDYEKSKTDAEKLRSEIEDISASNSKDDAEVEKLKLELLRLEQAISVASAKVLSLTEEISALEASKQVIVERKKYEVDDVKLESNIINLKESILELRNSLSSLESELETNDDKIKKLVSKKDALLSDYRKEMANKNSIVSEVNFKSRLLGDVKNKIDIARANIENDSLLPYAVKSTINNPRLKGLYGTLGSLIEVDATYSVMLDTALGFNQFVIVSEDEKRAKDAINYLKENKLGRATFFPLNIIKPKRIDDATLNKVKSFKGFIDIASNLVNFDTKYTNVVLNQLGNVLVVNTLDDANALGKMINYSYRIISLDGDVLHTGGSLTGGTKKTSKNPLSERVNLENLEAERDRLIKDIDYNNGKLTSIEDNLEILTKSISAAERDETVLRELSRTKLASKDVLVRQISSKESEIKGTENIRSNSLDKELEDTLNKYYSAIKEKDAETSKLEELKSKKSDLNDALSEVEQNTKKFNSEYNKKVNDLNALEVHLGKLDIKLDNLLLRLTDEYNITYERARNVYEVPDDVENSRGRVQALRKCIKDLGEVNLGAISEYERINTRYEFLTSQKEDLNGSINDLLKIIGDMDETMKEEFSNTFDKVNEEFKKVFTKLFKGGTGKLVLTNPENLLETGVDIIAEPPGKHLKNITLLSGGEKTLTAIALLFAILNVKVVPFCILDEVEAALDEANVLAFGTYLKEYEHKTEFIVITHKKKTMEYANTLYGITMQESGVSKLVSVKLEDVKK